MPPFCMLCFRCMIVLWYDHLHSVSVLIPFHSIDNSVFTHVNTVERSRKTMSVRVSATVERLLSNCFARMVYTTYKKQRILHIHSKGYKAPTIQKLLKILCAVALASQSLSRCSSVQGLFVDSLVRVDHWGLIVGWKISLSSKWSGEA